MYSNVLVPVNLSDKEHRRVQIAAEQVDPLAGVATLLHVIEEIEGLGGDEGERFYAGLRKNAEQVLHSLEQSLAGAEFELRCVIVVGKRSAAIVGYAEEQGCDLIVMGSHRVDPEQPGKGLWTTPHKVSLLADCPILLVR
jgi:nucleotide-binding universal stress UspA family protein